MQDTTEIVVDVSSATCRTCGDRLEVGTEITLDNASGRYHTDCAPPGNEGESLSTRPVLLDEKGPQ